MWPTVSYSGDDSNGPPTDWREWIDPDVRTQIDSAQRIWDKHFSGHGTDTEDAVQSVGVQGNGTNGNMHYSSDRVAITRPYVVRGDEQRSLAIPTKECDLLDFQSNAGIRISGFTTMDGGENADTFSEMARCMSTAVWGGNVRYVSDILVPGGNWSINGIVEDLRRSIAERMPKCMYVVSEHGDHVHVVHTCNYATGSCRCSFLLNAAAFQLCRRRRIRKNVRVIQLSERDWSRIFQYLCSSPRNVKEVGGQYFDGGLRSRYTHISEGSNPECRPERLVETCLLQGSGELQSEQSLRENGQNHTTGSVSQDDQDGVQDNGSTNVFQEEEEGSQEGPRQKKSRRKQRFRMIREIDVSKPQSIEELIYRYPCCPPEAFYNIPEFYANKNINWIDMKDFKVTIPLRNWAATLRRWSIHDFNKYYNDSTVFPYFNAYGSDICNMYYSISESLTIAKELLNYQFGDDPEVVIEFLTTLYNVIDKRVPKLNSICIKSPPSAGKNFFFDAVASYLLSYGMFGTANKNNNFSWADGAGKRLVLWNEPNYEQYHIEKIKELLGGDTTRIHVKYANDVSVQRVPIIILTNNHLNIISHPAFNDRLRSYEWMSAGFLKDYDKKLHPLMFYELLKDYGVINDNNVID